MEPTSLYMHYLDAYFVNNLAPMGFRISDLIIASALER